MNDHLEDTLRRELREVADRLPVPPQPALPHTSARPTRHWRPLLVAAVVTLIVGAVTALVVSGGGRSMQPAKPPNPTADSAAPVRPLTAAAPTVPYLFDGRLSADGSQVPGTWATVQQTRGVWVAQKSDNSWWWGTGAESRAIDGLITTTPGLSPDGSRLVVTRKAPAGKVLLSLIDTRSGDTINELSLDRSKGPDTIAVTYDEQVYFFGYGQQSMWLAYDGSHVVTVEPGGPIVKAATSAGVIVLDGKDNYLARVSATGMITREETIPDEEIVINPSGTLMADGGSWGDDLETTRYITGGTLDRSRQVQLQPPDDRGMRALAWEDDDLLLATLYTDGEATGLARCSIREERCLELDL